MSNRVGRSIAEAMRDEMIMKGKIRALLSENPGTVPQIANALKCSTNDVMFWMMAMWRYGLVEEVGKADAEGYYQYRPVL